jgi:hypothetical protein
MNNYLNNCVYFGSFATALLAVGFVDKHLEQNGIDLAALVGMNFSKVGLQVKQKDACFAFFTVSLGLADLTEFTSWDLIKLKNLTQDLSGLTLLFV